MRASGRLSLQELQRLLSGVAPGRDYELMCHPGRAGSGAALDPHVRRYHDWEGERAALTSPGLRALAAARGVEFVGFRDLEAPCDD